MEFLVAERKALGAATGTLHATDGIGDALDVAGGGVQPRQADHGGLDTESHVDQLEWTGKLSEAVAGAVRPRAHERAGAEPPRDQMLARGPHQCGSDGCA